MQNLRQAFVSDGLITQKTHAIYDYEFIKALQNMPLKEWLDSPAPFRCRPAYLEHYDQWIQTSTLNSVRGLDSFQRRDLINGTTQTFDEAYMKYSDKRLRVFRGEYRYHMRIAQQWAFIEDEPLQNGDYLIVSAPFCSTGDVHPQFAAILDSCASFNIPVIVDCAYFGTCENIHINVNHPAIESVSFSLSKGTGMGDVRSGIRYSNLDDNNPICQQNNYDHSVLFAARVGLYMMQSFSPDFIPLRYSNIQKSVCEKLGLTPTKCMHLALGDARWDDYKIDERYNRVGIRELVRAEFKKQRKGESLFDLPSVIHV